VLGGSSFSRLLFEFSLDDAKVRCELRVVAFHARDEMVGGFAADERLDGVAERMVETRAEVDDGEDEQRAERYSAPVAATHSRLSHAYVEARVGCVRAERLAVAALKAGNRSNWTASGGATAQTRTGLREFDRLTLRRFLGAVRAWPSAMLREAAALQLRAPQWLRRLSVEP
jgi:hypothetical protein